MAEDVDADIRTYGVVALNEECGFIQWVPNTTAVRTVLMKYYDAQGIKSWVSISTVPRPNNLSN